MSKWVQVETVALIGMGGGVAVGFAVSLTEKKPKPDKDPLQ